MAFSSLVDSLLIQEESQESILSIYRIDQFGSIQDSPLIFALDHMASSRVTHIGPKTGGGELIWTLLGGKVRGHANSVCSQN